MLLLASIAALMGLPSVGAQLDPTVDGCTKDCTPVDANGPDVRTGDETVKSVLYFHHENFLQNAVINTQPIHPDEPQLQSAGLMPTLITGNEVCCHFTSHGFGAYSSAGFVEIQDGEWRTHQEPGVAEDIQIVGDTITLYYYLSAYPVPTKTSDNPAPGHTAVAVAPQVGVHAVMTAGRNPGIGRVIAEGDSGTSGRINILYLPNDVQPPIYEVRVDLAVVEKTIPSVWNDGKGYAVQVTPYQVRDPTLGAEVTQSEVRAHAGPQTPPHMVVEIADPLVTKSMRTTLFNNALYFRWSVTSPWGSYDVDDRTLAITVSGAAEADPSKAGISRPYNVRHFTDHNGHFKPTNVTWKFDYRRAALPDGAYTAQMSVLNLQGTYRLGAEMAFRIVDGIPADVEVIGSNARAQSAGGGMAARGDSPSLAPLALLATIGGVSLLYRRGKEEN